MQTFLPYADFTQSARILDRQRLGKQRVETYQILRALFGESKGWTSHPATKMWRGHEYALCLYGIAVCDEWIGRGYKDTLRDRFLGYIHQHPEWQDHLTLPSLIGNEDFHRSHKSNLLRKDPTHYSQYCVGIPDDLEYIWDEQSRPSESTSEESL